MNARLRTYKYCYSNKGAIYDAKMMVVRALSKPLNDSCIFSIVYLTVIHERALVMTW